MSPQLQSTVRNRLLRRLSPDDFGLLQPHLQQVRTESGQTLIRPHEPITQLMFPESGFASVVAEVAENSGGRIEVGMTGREGLIGASPVLLDSGETPYCEFVQCPGAMLAIDKVSFCLAVDQSPTLRRLMLRYIQTCLIQARQTALVNAAYQMDVRLARWILMCHDRVDGNDIPVTHEVIAMLLNVRRSGATVALQIFDGTGVIKAQRGRVTVRDRDGLIALADGSYGTTETEYARLIDEV